MAKVLDIEDKTFTGLGLAVAVSPILTLTLFNGASFYGDWALVSFMAVWTVFVCAAMLYFYIEV